MLVVMLLALGGAHVASASAKLQGLPHDRVVHSGLPKGDVRGRIADVRAIEAQADALDHVHRFGRAGVGAARHIFAQYIAWCTASASGWLTWP